MVMVFRTNVERRSHRPALADVRSGRVSENIPATVKACSNGVWETKLAHACLQAVLAFAAILGVFKVCLFLLAR
jgi:hypothetical protein